MSDNQSKNRIVIDASLIPKRELERLAAPLPKIVARAFEDPVVQRDFEEWKKKREAKAK